MRFKVVICKGGNMCYYNKDYVILLLMGIYCLENVEGV